MDACMLPSLLSSWCDARGFWPGVAKVYPAGELYQTNQVCWILVNTWYKCGDVFVILWLCIRVPFPSCLGGFNGPTSKFAQYCIMLNQPFVFQKKKKEWLFEFSVLYQKLRKVKLSILELKSAISIHYPYQCKYRKIWSYWAWE